MGFLRKSCMTLHRFLKSFVTHKNYDIDQVAVIFNYFFSHDTQ